MMTLFNPPPENRVLPQHAQHDNESDEVGILDDVMDEPESYSEISLAKTYGVWHDFCF